MTLESVGSDSNWKQSKRAKESGKSYAESYYGSLKRAWNAVSGCEGVGTAYNVKDADGNVVLTWIEDAAAHVEAERQAEEAERRARKARNDYRRHQRERERNAQAEFQRKLEERQAEQVAPTPPEPVAPRISKKEQERENRASFARATFDYLANKDDAIKNLLNTLSRDGELAGDLFVREFANGTLKFKERKGYPFDKFYTKQYGWNDSPVSASETLKYLFEQWNARIKNEGFAREDLNDIRKSLLDKAKHMVVVTKDGEYIRGDKRYNYIDDINFIIMARVTDRNLSSEEEIVTLSIKWWEY